MKKRTIIIGLALVIVIAVASGLYLSEKWAMAKYCNKETLYERLNIDITDEMEATELSARINEQTLKGDENERLGLKIKIEDEDYDDFIDMIEEAGYLYCDWYEDDSNAVPHPEHTMEEWDMDYSKLEDVYEYCFTRQAGDWTVRCKVHVYVLVSENGVREVYICYTG